MYRYFFKFSIVSICYYCSHETNGVPIHFSCFKDFPWCLRCVKGQRESTKYLCNDCEEENYEGMQYVVIFI